MTDFLKRLWKIVPLAIILILIRLLFAQAVVAAANYDSLDSMSNGILVSETDMIDGYYQFSPIITSQTEICFSENWDNDFCVYGQQEAQIISTWWKQADITAWSNTRSFIAADERKGKMYVDYTNVGVYQGKQINLRITLLDWEKHQNLPDDSYTSVIVSVDDNKPVIDIKGLLSVTVRFSYFDDRMQPVSLEGHFTLSDLDFYQGFQVHDQIENIYFNQAAMARMGYEEKTGIIWSDGSETSPKNPNGWVTYTYKGESQTLTFVNGDKNPEGIYYHRIDYNNWENDNEMKRWKGIYDTKGGDVLAWMTCEFGYTSEIMCQFTKKADLIIEKTDAKSGLLLRNVKFELYEWNGSAWDFAGFLDWEEETGRYCRYNLEYTEQNQGKFKVEEEVPTGYVGNWTQEFVVDEPGTETILFRVTNQRGKGKITVKKTDADTKEPLSGTVFQIIAGEDISTPDGQQIYKKGDVADTITTQNGVAVSSELDYGTYMVQEIRPSNGYLLNDERKEVTLSWKDADTLLVTKEVSFEDQKNQIIIHKTGKKAEGEEATLSLSGAVFLYWNQEYPEEQIRIVTGSDGRAVLTGLATGTYCYKEIQAPSGYVTDTTVRQFTVDQYGVCAEATDGVIEVENDFIKLAISKKNSVSQKLLSGAQLRLTDEDGNLICEWISDEEPLRFNHIAAGRYLLEEISAPEGYMKAEPMKFEVLETGELQSICMEDPPLAEITLAKKIMTDEIVWSHGNPTFILTVKGKDLWGNDHEYQMVFLFDAQYVNSHTEKDGSVIMEKTLQGIPFGTSYEISEWNVNRYGVISVTGTENVSIQNMEVPEYGKNAEDIFLVTADLSINAKGTRVLFENHRYRYDDYSHNDIVINEIPVSDNSGSS
ncbi:MAG: hypothetical protein MR332_05395 [Fusicatenibacter sp.]|nr:hypothetical protein [Fusicatenibacter sp.]